MMIFNHILMLRSFKQNEHYHTIEFSSKNKNALANQILKSQANRHILTESS